MGVIRVLVVDDSVLMRKVLERGLSQDPEIEVVGCAGDPFQARDMIVKHSPDVLTLDVEMPRMNGIEFLKRIMALRPTPVVIVSSITQEWHKATMEAFEEGALDVVPKSSEMRGEYEALMEMMRDKVKKAARGNMNCLNAGALSPVVPEPPLGRSSDAMVAVAASMGGVLALREILRRLPVDAPGMVIVQRLSHGFSRILAARLGGICAPRVKVAATGDRVEQGLILIAPAEKQMMVHGREVLCEKGPDISGACPSADVLMDSIARHGEGRAMGILLSGTGPDGVKGLCAMRKAGAITLGQSRETSVIYGMAGDAYAEGGVGKLVSLDQIAKQIMAFA